jgi:tryptophan synthase alpha subunit
VADGVVVGSAFVRTVLEGGSPDQVAEQVATFRDALDRGA